MATVSDVLTRAAGLLAKGSCRGANARLNDGRPCGVFDTRAATYSMYGALCAVLGPGLGDDKALQASPAWKAIASRAWEAIPEDARSSRMEFALHDLNDRLTSDAAERMFLKWASEAEMTALGEWTA